MTGESAVIAVRQRKQTRREPVSAIASRVQKGRDVMAAAMPCNVTALSKGWRGLVGLAYRRFRCIYVQW